MATSTSWTAPIFGGHETTRLHVRRMPGTPSDRTLKGFFLPVYIAEELVAIHAGLAACSESEHRWCGGSLALSVMRNVRVDPLADRTWELAGDAPSGTRRYKSSHNLNLTLYVLADRITWLAAPVMSEIDLRLGIMLARESRIAAPPVLEPGALIVEHVTPGDSLWSKASEDLGGMTPVAKTSAVFPAARGADVPALQRLHFRDADQARAVLDDSRQLQAEIVRRYPDAYGKSQPARTTLEGSTIASRGTLPWDAVAAYA